MLHYTPLSVDNYGAQHCGKQQHPNNYYINGTQMKSMDSFPDLGVIRTTVLSHKGYYRRHYEHITSKFDKLCVSIWLFFLSNSKELLWPAFQIYILPVLMYCSPAR